MKSRLSLALAGLLTIVAMIIAFRQHSPAPRKGTQQTVSVAQATTPRSAELDELERLNAIPPRETPKELPEFRKSHRDDPVATKKLIDIISRHPLETMRLTQENQWVKRREIVPLDRHFGAIADQILRGEKIEKFEIPLFDGEMVNLVLNYDLTSLISSKDGTIYGSIEGDPDSQVVLGFSGTRSGGSINFPKRRKTYQYEAWGDGRVIVKEYSSSDYFKAFPCNKCRDEGTTGNHAQHGG